MRPADVTFAAGPEMDAGLYALRAQLRDGGAEAPPEVMGPVTALEEVRCVCRTLLTGRGGPNPRDRSSLQEDVLRSLKALGPETRKALGPALSAILKDAGELGKRLEHPPGGRALLLAVDGLLDDFASTAVRRAAWRDVVAMFLNHDSAPEDCELAVLQLVECVERNGNDWPTVSKGLESIVGDEAGYICRLEEPGVRDDEAGSLAGVPTERRLELCEEYLESGPTRDDVFVWFVIDNAALHKGYLRVGPIELFDQDLWPEELRAGGSLEGFGGFWGAPEIDDWDEAQIFFGHLPKAEHRLFARVSMSGVPIAAARERARKALVSIIDLANPQSLWILFEGSAVWREAGGWSGSSYRDPAELERAYRPRHPVLEPTAEGLEDFDEEIATRMVEGDEDVLQAVNDALWATSVRRSADHPAQGIVLAARTLERGLSQVRERERDTWVDTAERFLEAEWVRWSLSNLEFDGGATAMTALRMPHAPQELTYEKAHDVVFPPETPGRRIFDRVGFASIVYDISEELDSGTCEYRIVRACRQLLLSPEEALEVLRTLRERFEILLHRAARQRNAIVHGTATEARVLDSVAPFMTTLSQIMAWQAVEEVRGNLRPMGALEEARQRLLRDEAKLGAGERWVDIADEGKT